LAQAATREKILQLAGSGSSRERDCPDLLHVGVARTRGRARNFFVARALPATGEEVQLDALSSILRCRVIDWPSENGREIVRQGAVSGPRRLRAPLECGIGFRGCNAASGPPRSAHLGAALNELGASQLGKRKWPLLQRRGKSGVGPWDCGRGRNLRWVEGSRAAVGD